MSSQSDEERPDNEVDADKVFSDDFLADFDETGKDEDISGSTEPPSGEDVTDSLIGDWFNEDSDSQVENPEPFATTEPTESAISSDTHAESDANAGAQENVADDTVEVSQEAFPSTDGPLVSEVADAESGIAELVLTATPGRRGSRLFFFSLLACGLLAILLTPLVLMWGLGQDPLGLAPSVPNSLAMLVPEDMRLVPEAPREIGIDTATVGVDRPGSEEKPGQVGATEPNEAPKLVEIPNEEAVADTPDATNQRESEQAVADHSGSDAPVVTTETDTVAVQDAVAEPEGMAEKERVDNKATSTKPAAVASENGVADAKPTTKAESTNTVMETPPAVAAISANSAVGGESVGEPPATSVIETKAIGASREKDLAVTSEALSQPPVDLTALDNALERVRDSAVTLLAAETQDFDSVSLSTKKLLVDWYRSLANLGATWEDIDAKSFQLGQDINPLPEAVAEVYQNIAANEALQDALQQLGPMWLAAANRDEEGVVLLATLDDTQSIGPIWYSTAKLAGARAGSEASSGQVAVLSRRPLELTVGETVFITGTLLEGGEVWAVDCRPVR